MDQGRFALAYISVWLAATGIVVGAVMLLFLERGVISRLQALSSSVLRIGTSQDLSLRTSLGGKDQLAYLGAAINGMLDALERSTAQLRESEARNVAFLAAFPDMLLRLRRDGTLLDYRRPADGSYPALPPGLMGKTLREAVAAYPLVSRETVERALRAMEESAATGVPVVFEFATAGDRFFEARVVAMGAEEAFALVHDVTARKAAEEAERKEILLKEIHHRVKNNLQVISSLLDLQARAAPDPGTARLLRESKDRVRSMSLIHEKLYKSGGAEGVQFSEYVRDLTARLCHSFACTEETVGVEVDVDELSLDMDTAVPLGIIINELLTNALQYAFPDGRKGRVRISLHGAEEKTLLLSVRDDGVGLPAGVDYRSPASLGLRIVSTLAAQLHGTLAIEAGPGTVFTLSFPRP
jgi:two-component sensor histidine kinase/HAMP domain-containing protein